MLGWIAFIFFACSTVFMGPWYFGVPYLLCVIAGYILWSIDHLRWWICLPGFIGVVLVVLMAGANQGFEQIFVVGGAVLLTFVPAVALNT